MERNFSNMCLMDKAGPLLEAVAYAKTDAVEQICASEPENLRRLFGFAAGAAVIYQDAPVFAALLKAAEQKLPKDSFSEFAKNALDFSVREGRADCIDCVISFLKEKQLQIPPLEEHLAKNLGREDRRPLVDVLIKHGADAQAAFTLHEAQVMAEIRRHSAEILALRRGLTAQKVTCGIKPGKKASVDHKGPL